MSTSSSKWIATADHGDHGQPGSGFTKRFAGVKSPRKGLYELHVRDVYGSNQGCLEEHGRVERRYRSSDLDELMRIGITEVRQDEEFDGPGQSQLIAAIRDAIFDAQDAEQGQDIEPQADVYHKED